MEIIISETYEEMGRVAAKEVAVLLNSKPNAVLGLATGSTPLASTRSWSGCTRARAWTSPR